MTYPRSDCTYLAGRVLPRDINRIGMARRFSHLAFAAEYLDRFVVRFSIGWHRWHHRVVDYIGHPMDSIPRRNEFWYGTMCANMWVNVQIKFTTKQIKVEENKFVLRKINWFTRSSKIMDSCPTYQSTLHLLLFAFFLWFMVKNGKKKLRDNNLFPWAFAYTFMYFFSANWVHLYWAWTKIVLQLTVR